MTKEIRLRMSEETARNIITALYREVDIIQPWKGETQFTDQTAELYKIIMEIKWEFDIDDIQSATVRHMELLED